MNAYSTPDKVLQVFYVNGLTMALVYREVEKYRYTKTIIRGRPFHDNVCFSFHRMLNFL